MRLPDINYVSDTALCKLSVCRTDPLTAVGLCEVNWVDTERLDATSSVYEKLQSPAGASGHMCRNEP